MTKAAWVFPGQGSQFIGMGVDLLDVPDARARFKMAEEILGWSVPDICQQTDDRVSNTRYTQPCLYVIESILVDLLKSRGEQPSIVAGHSLGEYVALYAAEVFDFETGLTLVNQRAELMAAAAEGIMAALIGFDREQLTHRLDQVSGVVLANDNSPAQVVISGTADAVNDVLATVKAKRAVCLNVSGAFHSPLMVGAAATFQDWLDDATFNPAQVAVLSNVDPTPSRDGAVLKQRLSQQMTGSVRWREIMLQLPNLGVDTMVEVGPGNVLTGLAKRTVKELSLVNVGNRAQLDVFAGDMVLA